MINQVCVGVYASCVVDVDETTSDDASLQLADPQVEGSLSSEEAALEGDGVGVGETEADPSDCEIVADTLGSTVTSPETVGETVPSDSDVENPEGWTVVGDTDSLTDSLAEGAGVGVPTEVSGSSTRVDVAEAVALEELSDVKLTSLAKEEETTGTSSA